jgi:hypothetical protein
LTFITFITKLTKIKSLYFFVFMSDGALVSDILLPK